MAKKYWIGTGTRPQVHMGDQDMTSVSEEDVGVMVEADNLTIEPSGALTLWLRPDDEHRSGLIMAFAHGQWTKAHVVQS